MLSEIRGNWGIFQKKCAVIHTRDICRLLQWRKKEKPSRSSRKSAVLLARQTQEVGERVSEVACRNQKKKRAECSLSRSPPIFPALKISPGQNFGSSNRPSHSRKLPNFCTQLRDSALSPNPLLALKPTLLLSITLHLRGSLCPAPLQLSSPFPPRTNRASSTWVTLTMKFSAFRAS